MIIKSNGRGLGVPGNNNFVPELNENVENNLRFNYDFRVGVIHFVLRLPTSSEGLSIAALRLAGCNCTLHSS